MNRDAMKDYIINDCVYSFYIVKNIANKEARIREILSKGKIEGDETDIQLITPILPYLEYVNQVNNIPQLNNELWGIGIRISALKKAGIKYDIQVCQDCVGCKVLTIPKNIALDFSTFEKYDIVVLCPTEKDKKGFYRNKKIGNKNWPCWHRLSLTCKYILDYRKDDKGIDYYLYHKFNIKNYLEEEIIDSLCENRLF